MAFAFVISIGLICYVILKIGLYIFWCHAGLLRNREELLPDKFLNPAIGLGLVRAVLGIGFGYLIFYFTNNFYTDFFQSLSLRHFTQFLIYLDIYIPLSLIAWGIMSLLALHWLDWLWVVFGICISLLTDLPVFILMHGFPIGRVLC